MGRWLATNRLTTKRMPLSTLTVRMLCSVHTATPPRSIKGSDE